MDTTIILPEINNYKSELNLISTYDTSNSNEMITNIIPTTYIKFQNQSETVLNAIEKLINDFNMIEMNNGIDKKIVVKNKQVILTSTLIQKNNEETDNISINLGQCENKLKSDNNISENKSLYILEIITEEMGMKIPKINYEIYYPLNDNNKLEKLDLNSCKGEKIDI